MPSVVDPELMAMHLAAIKLYNRETECIPSSPAPLASIKATQFLARQANLFADALLVLMEDARQPLNPAAALLRTCLEAQAKANHLVSVAGKEREARAEELLQSENVGHAYYEMLAIKTVKDHKPEASNSLPRDWPYLDAVQRLLASEDTSQLPVLKKRYQALSNNWNYNSVIGRDKLNDPGWQNRSAAQRLQTGLYLCYVEMCAFVHSDPATLKLAPLLTSVSVAYNAVLAEVIALLCFFVALGKEKDQGLVNLKQSIMDFNVNEKILPSKDLPSQ